MEMKVNNTVIELVQGDITELETDAIVNAANCQLVLGAGVAGAIRKKAGSAVQAECDKLAPIKVGQAVITTGGELKAKHVIHTVGPRMGEGAEQEKLKNATLNSLKLADENNLKSIAFCAISTGVFGFPIERCAEVMLSTTMDYLKETTGLEKVVFCLYDQKSFWIFQEELLPEC